MKRPLLIWLAIVVPIWLVLAIGAYWDPIIRDGWRFYFWYQRNDLSISTLKSVIEIGYSHNNPRLGQLVTLAMYTPGMWHVIVMPLLELAVFYALATLALGRWPSLRRTDDALVFATIVAMVFVTARSLGPLLFYRPFTGNYTFGLLLNLLWLVPYRLHGEARCIRWWWTPIMLVLGVLAGLCNEHTGPGLIAAGLIALVVYWRRGERIVPWAWSGVAGMIVGVVLLLGAPGQEFRYGGLAAKQSMFELIVDRGIVDTAIILFAPLLFLLPLVLWGMLIVVARRRERSVLQRTQMVAAIVALVVAAVMVVTLLGSPKQGDRLYFAPMCLVCAAAAAWVCSYASTRRIAAAMAVLSIAVVSAILLICQHRLHAEFEARLAAIEQAPPGSVLHVAPYSQERSRYVLGDDFVITPLRGYVARGFGLAAIELDQRVPTTASPDEP